MPRADGRLDPIRDGRRSNAVNPLTPGSFGTAGQTGSGRPSVGSLTLLFDALVPMLAQQVPFATVSRIVNLRYRAQREGVDEAEI
jgi:hypothetical protein